MHVAAVDFTVTKLLGPQLSYLQGQGFSVRVACGYSTPDAAHNLQQFRPLNISFPRSPRPREAAVALTQLVRAVRRDKPALLHLHTPAAALAVRSLPRAVWPKQMRVIYTVHGFLHGWPPEGTRDVAIQRLEQYQARRTDSLLFQSGEDLREAEARRYASRLRYLGNGVEDAWFALRRPRRGEGPLRVIFVGRLVREKGVPQLIRALAGTTGVELALAGDAIPSDRDGVRSACEDLVASLCLQDRVRFLGMLTREQLLGEVTKHHVLALPSFREGLPRSVSEGLAAGLPCLVTRVRGSRELVSSGVNGLTVAPGDVPALRAALQQLADMDAPSFEQLSLQARATAEKRCRESDVFARLLRAYAELGVRP